ncbi:single-stranded DNA-binding protein [Clostridium novyi B str. ATCC 27606]|uniref:Single-stranded DNA-binding protein n=2 Tax=Clostridium TaxID=1485 RepID=A0AA40ISH1_CLONO|nr:MULTISPECIES: single-stranded DNA-binding protein [Clostridium]KEI11551.1 single-stranded DNA-binding protein [Clostridium novyi B str. NCTC 9691]KEI13118.1 single-stranded DNA-binding protein [Clostridium novyi B str. ATCC 27606]KEI15555.1 single-stranded DNA-binding protein [Clostridium haemolyticum NCTC 9693]KGN02094.1 single-stranded DNA-binding protein [Clostridium haemolyticum NCTC 8350]OOB75639.1 single-stranded DNA-binding protein [Clostridium haemolyticum]
MNKVVLVGRLTKDPELRFTPGTGKAVATFTLAVNRRFKSPGQPEADFLPIVVWGKTAENTANYVGKGSQVGVSGAIHTRSYEAKDGTRRYVTEIVADEVQFLDSRNAVSRTEPKYTGMNEFDSSNNNSGDINPVEDYDDDITPIDDGDIPF